MRKTKIVSTLGPASNRLEVLRKMMEAGVDIVRLNFSHGSAEEKRALVEVVREAARQEGRVVGILADLQGPKIRVAKFRDGKIVLAEGAKFILDADLPKDAGDENAVGIDYKELPRDVSAGDILLLDDGRLVIKVEKVEGNKIFCIVQVGGVLSNNKGINRQFGGLSAGALTDKDRADLQTAVSLQVDYIAISFVRSKADIDETKELIAKAGGRAKVISKIERIEAMVPETLDEIVGASDAVMVARGDLGVEIGEVAIPQAQKTIIECAHKLNKAVITATQMMETMITSVVPTRAEVSDVANAVLDGTDAVMLSAETATGNHPALVIQTMAKICLAAESQMHKFGRVLNCKAAQQEPQVALARGAAEIAKSCNAKAVVIITDTGLPALWSSRSGCSMPIYGVSNDPLVVGQMALYGNVQPIKVDVNATGVEAQVIHKLRAANLVNVGDVLVFWSPMRSGNQHAEMDGAIHLRVV